MSEVAAPAFEEEGESLSLRDYWLVVQRHRVMIAIVTLAVTVGATLFSATRTPIYQSRSELLVTGFQRVEDATLGEAGGSGSLSTELRLVAG